MILRVGFGGCGNGLNGAYASDARALRLENVSCTDEYPDWGSVRLTDHCVSDVPGTVGTGMEIGAAPGSAISALLPTNFFSGDSESAPSGNSMAGSGPVSWSGSAFGRPGILKMGLGGWPGRLPLPKMLRGRERWLPDRLPVWSPTWHPVTMVTRAMPRPSHLR
ncbi:hypothetical protein [Mycolicibacterium sp. P9-64]|uniref:hypothetical protein n=1 Tax=Mycolicibacterium sp. P9-64 TaxID=2024612 RepID=UPI0011F05448|nr:hypothetical protein [Mycolicibacterium sp. P9-64]